MWYERIICQTAPYTDFSDFVAMNVLEFDDCQSDQILSSERVNGIMRGELVQWGCDGRFRGEWGKSVHKTMAFPRHEFIHLDVLIGLAEVSPDGPLSTPLNVVGFGHSHPVRKI